MLRPYAQPWRWFLLLASCVFYLDPSAGSTTLQPGGVGAAGGVGGCLGGRAASHVPVDEPGKAPRRAQPCRSCWPAWRSCSTCCSPGGSPIPATGRGVTCSCWWAASSSSTRPSPARCTPTWVRPGSAPPRAVGWCEQRSCSTSASWATSSTRSGSRTSSTPCSEGPRSGPPRLRHRPAIAISFFVFQAISYVIDVGRGHLRPIPLLDFAVYLTFFAHVVAGPIVRVGEFAPS